MKEKELTLLIMAAGMGSRFGGLKQIEPVGPNGEFMIDYSIYDAMKAGFTKVVFIIKEENHQIFEETIGARVRKQIPFTYAYQRIEDIPDGIAFPEGRVKPWGTAHAILAAKDLIHENFAIINADDFYGRDAFRVVADFLRQETASTYDEYAVVGYRVANTMSENGSVKRGVLASENGYLTQLTESNVEYVDEKIIASPLNGASSFEITATTPVSMNMFGFTPKIFGYIEDHFPEFFEKNQDNLEKCEYLIPDVVERAVKEQVARVELLDTTAVWQGVTYPEDKEKVVEEIQKLIMAGEYPQNLWK